MSGGSEGVRAPSRGVRTVGPLHLPRRPCAISTGPHRPNLSRPLGSHSFKELKGCWRANSPTGYVSGTEALGGSSQATLQTMLPGAGRLPPSSPGALSWQKHMPGPVGLLARPGPAEGPSDLAAARGGTHHPVGGARGGVCRVRGSPRAQGALVRHEAVGRTLDACVACPVLRPPPRTPRRTRKSGPASIAARSQGSRVSEEPLAPSVIQLTFFKGPGAGVQHEHSFRGLALRGRMGVLGDPA